jgi:hypothetical protein
MEASLLFQASVNLVNPQRSSTNWVYDLIVLCWFHPHKCEARDVKPFCLASSRQKENLRGPYVMVYKGL